MLTAGTLDVGHKLSRRGTKHRGTFGAALVEANHSRLNTKMCGVFPETPRIVRLRGGRQGGEPENAHDHLRKGNAIHSRTASQRGPPCFGVLLRATQGLDGFKSAPADATCVRFSPSGAILCAGGGHGGLKAWGTADREWEAAGSSDKLVRL